MMWRWNRSRSLSGMAALLFSCVAVSGCAQSPPGGEDAFPGQHMIVDAGQIRAVSGDAPRVRAFGPFDLAQVRRDYGACGDGLGGALRPFSAAQDATGGALVTDSHVPGAVAEVVALVAQMPGVDATGLVPGGRTSCGQTPGTPTMVRLADGRQAPAVGFQTGEAADRLGTLVVTSRVGQDVVLVLVAFNGDRPDSRALGLLADTHHRATDLVNNAKRR